MLSSTIKTILGVTFKQLVGCIGYPWPCTIHKLYTWFAPSFETSVHHKISVQRDLRSKVQHMQRNLHLEVQHLMMLCTRGVNLLFPFVISSSNSLL